LNLFLLLLPVIYKLGDFVQYRFEKRVTVVGRLRGIALRGRQRIAKVERLVPYRALPPSLQSLEPEQQASRRLYSSMTNAASSNQLISVVR